MKQKLWPSELIEYVKKEFKEGVFIGMSTQEKFVTLTIILDDDIEGMDLTPSRLWMDMDDLCLIYFSTTLVIPRFRIKYMKLQMKGKKNENNNTKRDQR